MLSKNKTQQLLNAYAQNDLELTLKLVSDFKVKVHVNSYPAYPCYFGVVGKLTILDNVISSGTYYRILSNNIDCQFPLDKIRGESLVLYCNGNGDYTCVIWVNGS